MNSRFRAKHLVFLIAGVFLLFLIAIILHIIRVGIIEEVYIYADISECSNLQKVDDNATLVLHENSNEDKARKDLDYTDFFGCNYTASNLKFCIFAYTFKTEEDAQAYYYNVTGKHLMKNTSYSMNTGLFSGPLTLIVVDGNRAYRIETLGKYYKEMTVCLKECFSIDVMKRINSD